MDTRNSPVTTPLPFWTAFSKASTRMFKRLVCTEQSPELRKALEVRPTLATVMVDRSAAIAGPGPKGERELAVGLCRESNIKHLVIKSIGIYIICRIIPQRNRTRELTANNPLFVVLRPGFRNSGVFVP